MASSAGGQPQFRYAHPPSKVLHLRNLPWECTHEELVDLCKPFGKVINTKCNVGANRNQAFVEFVSALLSLTASSFDFSASGSRVSVMLSLMFHRCCKQSTVSSVYSVWHLLQKWQAQVALILICEGG